MNANDIPATIFAARAPSFAVEPPANAVPHPVIPGIWCTTAGAFHIALAARRNDVEALTGLPFARTLRMAPALVADCVIDDACHTEWNGSRFAPAPRWTLFLDGSKWGVYPTQEEAEAELRAHVKMHRHGTDQHFSIIPPQERERIERAAMATELRREEERAYAARFA